MSIYKDIDRIVNHYNQVLSNGENLLLVGLNDDRGFNFQKNYLSYIRDILSKGNYDITSFSAYSMFFNKTRHIDYYLKNNISLEEIELMQKYGTINEIIHAVGSNKLVESVATIISEHLRNYSSEDKSIRLSDSIKESTEPIILYSSGINDIMYETCINPFNARDYYKKHPDKYAYSLAKVTDEKETTLNTIISGHEKNFEKLLGINDKSRICAVGAYLYSKGKNYDTKFHEFVLAYNEALRELCKEYGITYVDIRNIENTRYQNAAFSYFKNVSFVIALEVIKNLSLSLDKNDDKTIKVDNFCYTNGGASGVLNDMYEYKRKLLSEDASFWLKKTEELTREENVFQLIKTKSTR